MRKRGRQLTVAALSVAVCWGGYLTYVGLVRPHSFEKAKRIHAAAKEACDLAEKMVLEARRSRMSMMSTEFFSLYRSYREECGRADEAYENLKKFERSVK